MPANTRLPLLVATILWISAITAVRGELPTAKQVLEIHRANLQKLSQLHIQLIHISERTPAAAAAHQKRMEGLEKLAQLAAQSKSDKNVKITIGDKEFIGEEAYAELERLGMTADGVVFKREIKTSKMLAQTFLFRQRQELFLSEGDYQVRQPQKPAKTEQEALNFKFPTEPVTVETLLTTYRDIGIFSRTESQKPAARWWHHSVEGYGYITNKHFDEVWHEKLPPYTLTLHPNWDRRHEVDAFFSRPEEAYQVVGEETVDGRLLTKVDVEVSITNDDQNWRTYRAWLDLKRGAVPMKIEFRIGKFATTGDRFGTFPANQVTTTKRIEALPNGGFYPAVTSTAEMEPDPKLPELTKEQYAEVQAGKRTLAYVPHDIRTWECTKVELATNLSADFFRIPFPEGQKIYDHDAQKVIGALEEQPLVKVGQTAPPLQIARWVDGKNHSLEEFKGQVVVLEFWSLSCSACRAGVPRLNEMQKQFAGKPVNFVSIHSAERNADATVKQITKFAKEQNWNFLAALDAGRMQEDSATSVAYGIPYQPMFVIIGPSGKIAYVHSSPTGPDCDEENEKVLKEWEAVANKYMQEMFEAVGETWPIRKDASEKEQAEIYERAEQKYLTKQIETALKEVR